MIRSRHMEKPRVDNGVREEIRRLRELADHLRQQAFKAFRKKKNARRRPRIAEPAKTA
jgi:hypothetical protein